MTAADRLNELLAADQTRLDRIMAVIAVAIAPVGPPTDGVGPPTEAGVVTAIDDLAEPLREPSVLDVLDHTYGNLGFSGDVADYYDPANSLIDRVIERRRGIPLTLAVIAAEIGRRHHLDLRAIGMPGHVLLGLGPEPAEWFDPFNRGAGLGEEDCRRLFARFHPIEAFDARMLRPMTADGVAIRTLNNLRGAFVRRGLASSTIPVLELRAAMASAEPADHLELATTLASLGRFDRAAEVFELLAAQGGQHEATYRARAAAMRANRN